MNKDDYASVCDQIVAECFPEQSLFWSINRTSVISLVEARSDLAQADVRTPADEEFQFGGELLLGLQAASAVAGLMASVLAIYNNYVKNTDGTSESKRLQLIDQLKNSGIAADKIGKIAEIVVSISK